MKQIKTIQASLCKRKILTLLLGWCVLMFSSWVPANAKVEIRQIPQPPVQTGSLLCEVKCPKSNYSCNMFKVSIYNRKFNRSIRVSSSGKAVFSQIPPGKYTVSIDFAGKIDAIAPFRNNQPVTIRSGERSLIRFN